MTTNTQTQRVVLRPPYSINVTAERTYLSPAGDEYDRTREVQVALSLAHEGDRRLVRLIGGVTGREAFELTAENVRLLQKRSWVACRGERGRQDRLVVPMGGLATFFAAHGIRVVEAEAA